MQGAYPVGVEKRESARKKRRRARLAWFIQNVAKASDLSAAVKTPATYISAILSGDRGLGDALAEKIEQEYELGEGWFDREESEEIPAMEGQSDPDDLRIPQFDTGGSMGGGLVLRDQPGVIHSWHVSPDWVAKNVRNFTAAKNLAIVTGFGDSMRPLYNPGDPLIVDTGVKTVEFDSIYFFRVGDEGFIKRLQRVPGEGLVAISENKGYRDWTIRPDMDFEVFGRVIKVWRGDDF